MSAKNGLSDTITVNHGRGEAGVAATHHHRDVEQTQSECGHLLPCFKFNSRGTRLEDPISGDTEPGTQWNETPGRPNHPHDSTQLQQANEIPSRLSRWSISSSFFSRWDYLLGFRLYKWMFTAVVAFLLSGCGMLMFPTAVWDPKYTNSERVANVPSVLQWSSHHGFYTCIHWISSIMKYNWKKLKGSKLFLESQRLNIVNILNTYLSKQKASPLKNK